MHVILMPLYKSFADSFVQIYINHHFQMEMPLMFGNFEDTPRIPIVEAWLKKAGYIFSRRDSSQSVQSRYINQALLREIIEKNKLTVVFQNEYRHRTGKLHRKTLPDLSVRWLLESFREIPGLADKIVIVPVMTSYERLFETGNLTNEMIKNERQLISLKEVLQKFVQMKNDQLGNIYVRYLKPIILKEYLQGIGCPSLK